jgi:hypothetical protein
MEMQSLSVEIDSRSIRVDFWTSGQTVKWVVRRTVPLPIPLVAASISPCDQTLMLKQVPV